MYKFGLKLWATNDNYVEPAKKLYDLGLYQYIELFAVPGSYDEFIKHWRNLKIPYVIHAPHYSTGLNFSDKKKLKENINLAGQAFKFADALHADKVIFHPGIDGEIEETVVQLNKINDDRILIENKPYYALIDDLVCVGNSPEEMKFILDNTNVGFCLDLAHGIYSANARNEDCFVYLKDFLKLNPEMFHLADGDSNSVYDQHKNIGDGTFDIQQIFNILPVDFNLTIETKKNFNDSLSDFERDVILLKAFLKKRDCGKRIVI